MDGTLVDTEPVGMETLAMLFGNFNIILTKEDMDLFDKVWRRDGADISFESFMSIAVKRYIPEKNPETFISNFYQLYEQNIIKADILTGVSDALNYLKTKYKLAVVTASTKDQAFAVLKIHDWMNMFDIIITHDDFIKSKPDPEAFLLAAHALHAQPEECVVVEDSKNGSLSGKNAGMTVIGVRAGNKHEQDLSAASIVLDTMSQIKDYL